jgi:glycosyltransferase involved in cell wall biosynthesis
MRDGAGRAWVNRRHDGALGRPAVGRGLARCAGAAALWALRREPQRAAFKLIDAVVITSAAVGYLRGNAAEISPSSPAARGLGITVFTDLFPVLSETFVSEEVRALIRAGHRVRVESTTRPARPSPSSARGIVVHYTEDEGIASRLWDLCGLAVRHPFRSSADLRSGGRWRTEEEVKPLRALAPRAARLRRYGEGHLHAHFAGHSALDAMRLGRLLALPYSVTAHAHDIFHVPSNLQEKLERAAFVSTGCDYNVRHLRGLLNDAGAGRVHEIVMGVDADRFKRTSDQPGGRTVVAVGRLVEQKGFRFLIEAAAQIEKGPGLDRLAIIGAGPLEGSLRELAADLALDGKLELRGARDPEEVRRLLEEADVLAMPCVVTEDGNRDSMPVVVKEALAMEVPVVASDEVGLPELVHPEWGRLIPPADSEALAAAIEELLALPVDERRRMGRAGREWVKAHCNTDIEARKLADLVRRAGAG